jgi:hypothetical protein
MTKSESREMYGEIAALVSSLAKAFALTEAAVITALEKGEITMDFGKDANGNPFVMATHGEKTARIYQGAIKHADVKSGPEP